MKLAEKINLGATVLGPLVICGLVYWTGWSINAKLDLRQKDSDARTVSAINQEHQFVQDNYVSKPWFEKTQSETNQHLESINNTLTQVQVDLAKISR